MVVKIMERIILGVWEDGRVREEVGGGVEGVKVGLGLVIMLLVLGFGRVELVEGMFWVEVVVGEGRRGVIFGEIWFLKGKIVGEDGIVFVVGKEEESEEREMKLMSVKIKDEVICFLLL